MAQRILLIDHRPEHMRQPVIRLQLEGYEVDEASTAADGLAKLRADGYDLVLLDAELPGTDGWGALREIREDDTLADTKVIVFMAAKGETGQLGLYEVQGELRRPFAIGELLKKVREVLSGSEPSDR
ncbi:MAG TPA: response regulator [Actinomycetota bacterium]|nr:response regulator [Actinomycetota bacterium]